MGNAHQIINDAWQGLDPTRPVTEAAIPQILEQFEAWILANVAPRKRRPSPRTVRSYRCDAEQFLQWLVQQPLPPLPEQFLVPDELRTLWEQLAEEGTTGIPLLLVTPEVAQAHMEYLVAPGHQNGGSSAQNPRSEDGSYSPATLAKKRTALNRFFTFTRKRKLTFGNPLEDAETVIRTPVDPRSQVERIKALTERQAQRLLETVVQTYLAAENPDKKAAAVRDRVMIDLMMLHGLRNIEVHRLDLEDYEPKSRDEHGALRVLGKGDKPRTIILCPEMQEELNLWLRTRELYRISAPALFVSLHRGTTWGRRLSQRSIRQRVDVYLELAGLKREGVSCHALRHTYATLYVEKRGKHVNREVLAASMGHEDPKVTRVYIDWVNLAQDNPSAPLMEIWSAAMERAEAAAEAAER
jgi:site-specific recombinase XerD